MNAFPASPLKFVLFTLGACLATAVLPLGAADLALVNGELKVAADGALTGWKVGPEGTALFNEPAEETGGLACVLAVTQTGEGCGQLTQRVAIKEPGKRIRVSTWLKGSISRAAFLEIKLFAGKTELKRTDSSKSTQNWSEVSVEVDTTGATHLEVLERWYLQEKYKGGKVCFANARFTEIGQRVVLVGDSSVADYESGGEKRGWGQMLPGLLKEQVLVTNYAVDGATADSFRQGGQWKQVLESKPDVVIIQFGQGDARSNPTAPGHFQESIRQYAEEAKAAGISVALATPPRRREFQGGKPGDTLAPYADAIRQVAAGSSLPLVDLYELSGKYFQGLGEDGSVTFFCSYKDRSHYSETGARWLADALSNSLAQQYPAWKSLLAPQAPAQSAAATTQ